MSPRWVREARRQRHRHTLLFGTEERLDDDTFEQLRALIGLAREHRLSELSIESADATIHLRRGKPRVADKVKPRAPLAPGVRVAEIRAPLLGVFYRAPAPDAPPYVEVGDWIEPGQTVGLIEAMKVFNEIDSEIEGRVAGVLVASGELVEAGQVLVAVELAS